MLRVFLVYIFLTSFLLCSQEQLTYHVFNEANSNIGSDVNYNVHQTPDGIIYVSGNEGIQRFDGGKFYSYPKEGKGIAISSAQHDHSGRLWANTFHGDIYYLEDDSLYRHPVSEKIQGITNFHRLKNGFYLSSRNQLFKLNEDLTFHQYELDERALRSVITIEGLDYAFYFVGDNYYDLQKEKIVPTPNGLFRKEDSFPIIGDTSYFYLKVANMLVEAKSSMDGVRRDSIHLPYDGKVNYFGRIENHFYICGMQGIRIYSLKGKLLHDILPKVQATRVIKDSEGNLLVSTASHGLIMITDLSSYHYNYDSYLDEELIIRSTADPNGVVYHGTNAGLVIKHDVRTREIDTIRLSARSEVNAIYYDTLRKKLFVYSDILFRIHPSTLDIEKMYEMTSMKQIASNKENIVLGARSFLARVHDEQYIQHGSYGWTISLVNYDERSFLMSTKKGFYFVDSTFNATPIQYTSLSNANVQRLVSSGDGEIYFLNNNQQIYRFRDLASAPELIYEVPGREIQDIEAIPQGIMLFTKSGARLISYEKGKRMSEINGLNGLYELHCIRAYYLNHQFYFVHNNSISILQDLPDLEGNTPALHFLSVQGTFTKNNNTYSSDYSNNVLALKLHVSNAISAQGSYTVYYQIPERDIKWNQLYAADDYYEFQRLPIGKYTVEFLVKNEKGQSSSIYPIKIQVNPPFYLSKWFILLMLVLLILSIILLIRYFVRRANHKAAEKLEKQKLESRALNAELTAIRSQMNPHFIFNVLTAIQSKVIEGNTDAAYQNIGDFAKLIRNVLDKSGKEFLLLDEELELIKNYVKLENTRFEVPIKLYIDVDDPTYFDDISIPTLMTQPFIENAIKHAFPGSIESKEIRIVIKRFNEGFTISIKDNGVGIENSIQSKSDHNSFALHAMDRRIANLKKVSMYDVELTLDSNNKGTTVKLIFKWKRK